MTTNKKTQITIDVNLDENKIPEKLIWSAPDGGVNNKISKAIFLSIWDHKNKESLSIDLWTKEMPVEEMNEFFYQSLLTMGDAFYKATDNDKYNIKYLAPYQLIDLNEKKFDICVSTTTLEHFTLDDLKNFLKDIKKNLNLNGLKINYQK